MPDGEFSPFGHWGAYVISSRLDVLREACRAGAKIVQLRAPGISKRELLARAHEARVVTHEHHALLIINDHIDIAIVCNADGVHLGQDDLPIEAARCVRPTDLIVGVSTHSLDQARQAEHDGADYLGIGPVFGTPTKPDYPPIGLTTVATVASAIRCPLVAIGGLGLKDLDALRQVGIRNVAMVRGFDTDTAARVQAVNTAMDGTGVPPTPS